jgi:hypothetical protein
MKIFAWLLLLFAPVAFSTPVTETTTHITINASSGPCPVTVGTLTLSVTTPRSSGISPFLVFYDATGTTDTAITGTTTVFQDVTFTWNFGDGGTSGTSTWAYGSRPGVNSRNVATGGVAAHLYITSGSNAKYTATVTATDGANTATCTAPVVTAYDPAGPNGFIGRNTTCVSSSGTPVAGSGGCPAGAAVLNSSSAGAAVSSSMSGKRVLFKCGDTFTGDATAGGTKWSVGAYGSCTGTQTNRPIMTGAWSLGSAMLDGRISDLDWESTGSYAISTSTGNVISQLTLWNLLSNGNNTSYYLQQGNQMGLVQTVMTGMGKSIGTYFNLAQNNCANGSNVYQCGQGSSAVYNNINYGAMLGSSFDGTGATTSESGIEAVRVGACRMCVFENSTFKNANNVGATLKLHSANTFITQAQWIGQYLELIEVSDDLFMGQSGAQLVEIAPQNNVTDERLRNVVFERNVLEPGGGNGRAILFSVQNGTIRDNAFNDTAVHPLYDIQIAKRGIEYGSNTTGTSVTSCPDSNTANCKGNSGAPVSLSNPQYVEIYNNTCYGGGTCIAFSNSNMIAAGNNSIAKNNLMYNASGGTVVNNGGTGNTVSNNTGTVTANPGFTNASSTFLLISDFKPTANFSGGVSVPVQTDALGVLWPPTWDLGAMHH